MPGIETSDFEINKGTHDQSFSRIAAIRKNLAPKNFRARALIVIQIVSASARLSPPNIQLNRRVIVRLMTYFDTYLYIFSSDHMTDIYVFIYICS